MTQTLEMSPNDCKADHSFGQNILVTGGAGFIGSTLVAELLREGHQVTVLDNLTWGIQGLASDLNKPGFQFIRGDIRDHKQVKRVLEGKDAVVHLAALVGHGLCESNKKAASEVNVEGSKTIAEHLSDDQLLIYASSGSIYGKVDTISCSEETEPNPQTQYAKTKYEAEKAFWGKGNVVALRFATAFGVSYRMRLDLLVNQFVYEAVKKKSLVIVGRNSLRSVIHVRDIAGSIIYAINHRSVMQGQIFNVGSSELSFTKEEIARHIEKGVSYDLQFADSLLYDDGREYNLKTDKIARVGYRTQVSLDQGITELIEAVRELRVDRFCFNT